VAVYGGNGATAPPEESDDEEGDEPGQGAAAAEDSDGEGADELMEYDGPEDSLNVLRAHGDAVISLAWHPMDPQVLASGACDDKAFISRVVGSGPEAVVQEVELAGHTDTVASLAWRCGPTPPSVSPPLQPDCFLSSACRGA